MNNVKLICFLLFLSLIGISSCSKKKGIEKFYGTWKAIDFDNEEMKNKNVEVSIEIKKDTIISISSVKGVKDPDFKIPYVLKSISGDTTFLEGTHPQTLEKGYFKLMFKDDKLIITNPDNITTTFEKQ